MDTVAGLMIAAAWATTVGVALCVLVALGGWAGCFKRRGGGPLRTCVVVLGDIGRSPRMQYHALSLAKAGNLVDLVGYAGATPTANVRNHPSIRFVHLRPFPSLPRYLFVLSAPLKVAFQVVQLFVTLTMRVRTPDSVLIQNPPSIPTIAVARAASWLQRAKLVVDWHNYGWSILALSLGETHPFVGVARWYEQFFGRMGDAHLCVTRAMARDLGAKWSIRASTLYDRPPPQFRESTVDERHELFVRLRVGGTNHKSAGEGVTPFTRRGTDENVTLRPDRPALLVSSTSWTEDEDFGVLLDALVAYDNAANGPHIVCVITGKGPLKEFYEHKIESLNMIRVRIQTVWLEPEDYPVLIGSADLGICLHKSSSGLDLPMKVVDMFGCGLPVCAINFQCLDELVKDDVNGLIFNSSDELSKQIQELFKDFPTRMTTIEKLKGGVRSFQTVRWDDAWDATASFLFC